MENFINFNTLPEISYSINNNSSSTLESKIILVPKNYNLSQKFKAKLQTSEILDWVFYSL